MATEKPNNQRRTPGQQHGVVWLVRTFDRFVIWLSTAAHTREAERRRLALPQHQCELAGCKMTAVHFVKWGKSVNQEGNLCEPHMRELWDKVHSQVAVGLCWWEQSLPRGVHTTLCTTGRETAPLLKTA